MSFCKGRVKGYLRNRVGIYLPTDFDKPIASASDDAPLQDLADLEVTCDAGYIINPWTGAVTENAANVLATALYVALLYGQFESERTNEFTRSQELDHADCNPRWLDFEQVTDPLGGNTAYKLKPTTDEGSHYIRQTINVDGSSYYTYSKIVKADGYDWVRVVLDAVGYAGNSSGYFDVKNGTLGTMGDGVVESSIQELANDFFLITMTALSDVAIGTVHYLMIAEDDLDTTIIGDGTKGVIFWNPQLEVGAYPTSPIKTEATPVTRSAVAAYWASAVVSSAVLAGKFELRCVPHWSSSEKTDNAYLLAIDANNFIRFNGTSKKIEVYAGGVKVVESGELTVARKDEGRLRFSASEGMIITTGFTDGNGTETGTAWEWSAGDLFAYSDHDGANNFDGLGTGLYRW